MTPTPDKKVLDVELRFAIALPRNYRQLGKDQQKATRRAWVDLVARHPDEDDATRGTAMAALQRGDSPSGNGLPWRNAALPIKGSYPTDDELRAFVAERLALYNQAIREPAGEPSVVVGEPQPTDDPGGPGGPRGIRYVIVDGRIVCIVGFQLKVRPGGGGSSNAQPGDEPFELEVPGGDPPRIPVVAEVAFNSRRDGATGSTPDDDVG